MCCFGRDLKNGRFEFKVRPELQEAFEETGILEGVEVMEGKNISCIMANIAWNENNWKSPSDNKTNFRWTQVEGNIPNESWNFDFDNPRNSEEKIFGFIQFTHPPKNAEKDKFLIIFRSDNKIIGFYGNAEIKKVPLPIKEDEYENLLGDKKLSVLLENKIDDSNHNFLFGKDRISQGGFNYLNPIDAQTILDEAIKLNPNQIDTLEKIKEWLNQGDTQMEGPENIMNSNKRIWKVSHGTDEFTEEEITECLNGSYVCVHKNTNAMARSSLSQGENFTENVNTGDLFYLCRSNQKILLIGKFTSDPIKIEKDGWAFRKYEKLYTPIKNGSYNGPKKWWTPNYNSTFIEIKKNDYPDFEKHILKPFFGIDLKTLNLINGEKNMEKINEYANLLKNTKNLILTGAPGTGKTFMAKQIAEKMGCTENEICFVQFHPSYDYTDFVEGLRPKQVDGSDQIGFERKDGVFKAFCEKALKSSSNTVDNFEECWEKLVSELNKNNYVEINLLSGKDKFKIELNEPGTGLANRKYKDDNYENGTWIKGKSKFFSKDQLYKVYKGLPGVPAGGHDNYRKAIVEFMKERYGLLPFSETEVKDDSPKNFVFIIDEINRGEVAKIFGELFYCVDPGYRGKKGRIKTQYQNLIKEGEFQEGFFIPENVYIIGTMNDIDRSVESMDFAFRRRFTWVEVKAEDTQYMLDAELDAVLADEAKRRMENLNSAISGIEGLGTAYHIGASYFLKLDNYGGDFDQLWKYHLKGLLEEYLRGNPEKDELMKQLEKAYQE